MRPCSKVVKEDIKEEYTGVDNDNSGLIFLLKIKDTRGLIRSASKSEYPQHFFMKNLKKIIPEL